ncbi:MAG: hypothetical protein IVW54_17055 [Candidatus Binataceae bacterium]|nr:hypothetical protein [Candidatus Binataceae bacterium]
MHRSNLRLDKNLLKLINQARSALRMARIDLLPRGIAEKSNGCFVSKSLGIAINEEYEGRYFAVVPHQRKAVTLARAWKVASPEEVLDGWGVYLPASLERTLREFDAHRHPDLEIRSGGQFRMITRAKARVIGLEAARG